MPSVTDDFQLPIMYEDMRNPFMGNLPPVGMYPGAMAPYTNYLGGMKMQPELQNDKFVHQNGKKRNANAFMKAMIVLGSLVGLAVLKNKGAFKWVSTKLKDGTNWVKNLFKSNPPTPPAPPTPTPPPPPTP